MTAQSQYLNRPLREESEARLSMMDVIKAGARPKPLACPFCSSPADAGRIGFTDRYGVTCTNEDCPVEAQATGGSLIEAVRLWNTRGEVVGKIEG